MAHAATAFTVRPFTVEEWPAYRAIRLRALADAPDAFGSTLAAEEALAPETWAARLACSTTSGIDRALAAEANGMLVGLAWAKEDAADASIVNLFQMWVAPQARGHGVAAALLDEAVRWATERGAQAVQLGVTCTNVEALRLYERAGFVDAGVREPLRPGSELMEQRMRLTLPGPAPAARR
ncbi:GNAT family N-acetyltransferase [Telluria beijingensis]|uniref:GNAT family N-acetyltransferase n=1 Tax=Telluria beijingensis TaxID=3068633 RepID=UPI0027958FB2|nr:GNAT family N-acetyltransferase [Massilia sp. REN29]